jgi:HemY protein
VRVRWLIWLLVIAAAAVAATIIAGLGEGYVLLVIPPWRIDLSLNIAVLLTALIVVAGYLLLHAAVITLSMPARVRSFQQRRAQTRARETFAEALRSYFEGRFGKAERAARSAFDLGEQPVLSGVLAARAAHGLRNYSSRDEYLSKAAEAEGDGDDLRLIAQAEMLLEERRYHDALEVLRRLPRRHTAALRLELRAHQLARNWDQVLLLLPQLEKRKVFDPSTVQQIRRHAFIENLKRKALDAQSLRDYWAKMPADQKREPRVAATAAQCFATLGGCAESQRVIEEALEAQWDSAVLALYADCLGANVTGQLERAEGWLKSHPRDAVLLLVLGRLCAHQQLWGKAQSYLEASLSIEPTHSAHLELARLFERNGKPEAAAEQYRQALELTLAQLRQLGGGRRRPAI